MEPENKIYIGHRHEWGGDAPFGIDIPARRQHVYVIGQTGSGKYHLSLTLAHQYMGQLDEGISDAVFGNVGTLLAFRVSEADGSVLERQFGGSFTRTQFTGLENFEMCARLLNAEPFLAKSFPPLDSTRRRRKIVMRHSRQKYCRREKSVEEKIERWLKWKH